MFLKPRADKQDAANAFQRFACNLFCISDRNSEAGRVFTQCRRDRGVRDSEREVVAAADSRNALILPVPNPLLMDDRRTRR